MRGVLAATYQAEAGIAEFNEAAGAAVLCETRVCQARLQSAAERR